MPDVIQEEASRIKKIRHPIETSNTKQNVYRATKLNIKQTTVVMAFVLVRLSIYVPPSLVVSGTQHKTEKWNYIKQTVNSLVELIIQGVEWRSNALKRSPWYYDRRLKWKNFMGLKLVEVGRK